MSNKARDPLSYICQLEPGKAVFLRESIDEELVELAWLLRATTAEIRALGKRVAIEFRAGLFWVHDVGVLPVLVNIEDRIFETWLNEHAQEGGFLTTLASQQRVLVHFHGDDGIRLRSIVVANQLKDFAGQALAVIRQRPVWTMAAYTLAKEMNCQQFPEPRALWFALQPG